MKKIIPYILILLVAISVGFFSYAPEAQAAGTCWNPSADKPVLVDNKEDCLASGYDWTEKVGDKAVTTKADPNKESALYGSLDDCGVIIGGSLLGCFQVFTYLVFVTVPSFLMGLAANFFNFLASLTISSEMYKLDFIDKIWKVVRDFANIFFILILLYAAFQIILGLHESGAKKIIGMVILVALLVNFSLFFTKIVIDSSNIVALIFYNRIDTTNVGSYEKIGNVAKTGVAEKDMAGALVSRFNINTFFDGELFKKLGEEGKVKVKYKFFSSLVLGSPQFSVDVEINPYVLISMMVAYGLVVYALTYAFFMTAMSFLGRMITLMMLMIISPLAFVTAAVPKFKGISTIGFDSWLKKLLEASFVAAIFMFILYIISEILAAKIFDNVANEANTGIISMLIMIFIPAILIVVLLLKGTKYAKSASGEFTEGIIKGVKVIGGLAGGIAVGGGIGLAAAGMQGTLGHLGKRIFENKGLIDAESKGSRWAKTLRTIGGGVEGKGGMAGSSFDLRRGAVGGAFKAISAATGANLGVGSKFLMREEGGYEADLKRRDEKRKKRAEGLKIKEGEEEKQKLNEYEEGHQKVSIENTNALHDVDLDIAGANKRKQYLKDVFDSANKTQDKDGKYIDLETENKRKEYEEASNNVRNLEKERSAIKNGMLFDEATGKYNTHNGLISQKTADLANEAAEVAAKEVISSAAAAIAAPAAAEAARAAVASAMRIATNTVAARAEAQAASLAEPTNIPLAEALKIASENEKKANEALAKTVDASAKANVAVTNTAAVKLAAENRKTVADGFATAANEAASRGTGYSQNDYEDRLLPHQKHAVEEVSKGRARKYATNLENQWAFPWNKAARKKSAHEIRMGAKVEKDKGGHGVDVGGHLASDFLAAAIVSKVSDHGHDSDKGKK